MTAIAVLDYGMGNLRSVAKAFEHVGCRVLVTADPEQAAGADGVVLPGVGAFPLAMERLTELGHVELIRARVAGGAPVLGICLGMQLAFERSSEGAGAAGLGLLAGGVEPIDAPGLKVPHIGWAEVAWEANSELTAGVGSGTPFYFVHSLAARPDESADLLGSSVYGERFACAVERPPFYGLQFHPEKSSAAGLRLLDNFAGICARAPAAA